MKSRFYTFPFLLMTCLMGCSSVVEYDLQGHRGARGLLPENSIPGFLLALEYGVDTIEMDVVVSADSQVVVSHEPWMSAEICSHPDSTAVDEEEAMSLNLFTMSYERIALFDCGSRGNERFPEQEPMSVAKPLLVDALRAVESAAETPVRYNIEIKSRKMAMVYSSRCGYLCPPGPRGNRETGCDGSNDDPVVRPTCTRVLSPHRTGGNAGLTGQQ